MLLSSVGEDLVPTLCSGYMVVLKIIDRQGGTRKQTSEKRNPGERDERGERGDVEPHWVVRLCYR